MKQIKSDVVISEYYPVLKYEYIVTDLQSLKKFKVQVEAQSMYYADRAVLEEYPKGYYMVLHGKLVS